MSSKLKVVAWKVESWSVPRWNRNLLAEDLAQRRRNTPRKRGRARSPLCHRCSFNISPFINAPQFYDSSSYPSQSSSFLFSHAVCSFHEFNLFYFYRIFSRLLSLNSRRIPRRKNLIKCIQCIMTNVFIIQIHFFPSSLWNLGNAGARRSTFMSCTCCLLFWICSLILKKKV